MRTNIQLYARMAGILFVISIAAGGFGEGYVPMKLIDWGNAAATAANLKAMDQLYRFSFAGYLVEATCDIALAAIFYVLLKPVSRGLALIAAFLAILSTATFAVAEMFYFVVPTLLLKDAHYLQTFSADQINTLLLLSLRISGLIGAIASGFYGMVWIVRGLLIVAAGYIPRLLGVLVLLGGVAFATRAFGLVLAPGTLFASEALLFVMAPGGVLLGLWLLVMGVNVPRWEAKAGNSA